MGGKSQRLQLSDVRKVFCLIGEARELDDEPAEWRAHVLAEAGRAIGAPRGLAIEGPSPSDPRRPMTFDWEDQGWDLGPERNALIDYVRSPQRDQRRDPSFIALLPMMNRFHTTNREQLVADREWYGSDHVQIVRRACGVDAFMTSSCPLPHAGVFHLFQFFRPWGERRPFTERERRWVHLMHEELARVWSSMALVAAGTGAFNVTGATPALGPRLRQVLAGLLTGEAEKQIAARLGLSRHTVHNYVTELHHRFKVSSLGELLARARPRPAFRPRLMAELRVDPYPHARQPRDRPGVLPVLRGADSRVPGLT